MMLPAFLSRPTPSTSSRAWFAASARTIWPTGSSRAVTDDVKLLALTIDQRAR